MIHFAKTSFGHSFCIGWPRMLAINLLSYYASGYHAEIAIHFLRMQFRFIVSEFDRRSEPW